jgi:putative oxidoreductase
VGVETGIGARKLYADGKGKETEAPVDEIVEVGAFTDEPGKSGLNVRDGETLGMHLAPSPLEVLAMNDATRRDLEDAGKLLLRLTIGLLILLHGLSKLSHGVGGISGMLEKANLPGILAYGTYVGEVLAPLLLIAGVWTRAAAAVIAVNMVVAIALAHAKQIFSLNDQGGWAIELQALYLFGAITVMLLGAGRYSAAGESGRLN